LPDDYFYFLSGPQGLQNQISSDAPMHRICAEFSLQACPHLYLQKSERRDNDALAKTMLEQRRYDPGKPTEIFLIKADKIKLLLDGSRRLIHFRPISFERYHYQEGKLCKATS